MAALLHPVIFYRFYRFHKRGNRPIKAVIQMAIASTERNA
jgi:hypothetical protein